MANEINVRAVVDDLRMMANQVTSGAINPTGSAEHDHWGESGSAGGYSWSFDVQHGGVSDETQSSTISAQLNDLADKIESGVLEPVEQGRQSHMPETATDNWADVGDQRPTGFTYTVVVKSR